MILGALLSRKGISGMCMSLWKSCVVASFVEQLHVSVWSPRQDIWGCVIPWTHPTHHTHMHTLHTQHITGAHTDTHTHTCTTPQTRPLFLLDQTKGVEQDPYSSLWSCCRGQRLVKMGWDGQHHARQPWGECYWVPWP